MTRKELRQALFDMAANDFKDHVLEVKLRSDKLITPHETEPIAWRCAKPGTGISSFWVAELPGCLVQYGDVGGLLIDQGPSYNVAWLRGSIKSVNYVLEKAKAQKTRFVPELFAEYVAEHEHAKEEAMRVFGKGRREDHGNPWTYENYFEYLECTGDTDVADASFDYELDVLWAYAALVKFVELLEKGNVRTG